MATTTTAPTTPSERARRARKLARREELKTRAADLRVAVTQPAVAAGFATVADGRLDSALPDAQALLLVVLDGLGIDHRDLAIAARWDPAWRRLKTWVRVAR